MVEVSVYTRDGGNELYAEGHATGSPEVCAAVSAILTTLAGWLSNNPDSIDEDVRPEIDLQPGDAYIFCKGDARCNAVFEAAVIGLLQLQQSYPDYIDCFIDER